MTKYIVTGGTPICGQVRLHGAKNAGFKAMIAALLADSSSTICQLGLISEIGFAKQVISQLGGKVTEENDPHCLIVDPKQISESAIRADLSLRSRFSIMYVGPLLARFGRVELPEPGGDISIGRRPLDRHIDGLKALGAEVSLRDGGYLFKAPKGLTGTTYRFAKSTHNGTEVLLLAAVKARGTTILKNAAEEPEIDDLIKFLNLMGAKVERVEPRVIKVIGVSHLSGAHHTVMKDRNEAVTFACAALATKGDVLIKSAEPNVLGAFLEKVGEAGGQVQKESEGLRFKWIKPLLATDLVTNPYPGFMTDWQPLWSTLMTQAVGESMVHETVYERRFDFVPGLVKMGAKIQLFQPEVEDPGEVYSFNIEDDRPENKHAIRISGPTNLTGTEIEVNNIRSGATALLAGIVARGHMTVLDVKDQIKRGYEGLEEQLVNLGAKIEVVSDL